MEELESILTKIPYGKKNAINLNELCRATDMKPTALKRRIRNARMCGVKILSSSCGYWLHDENDTDGNADINRFIRKFTLEATARFATISQIRKEAAEIPGQQSFRKELEK